MRVAASADGLSMRFGSVEVLRDLSLQVREGEIYGVVGANGVGKTTLMSVMQGCATPDTGSAQIFGCEASALGIRERAQLGVQLDRGGLPPNLRALELLAFMRELYRRGEDPRRLLGELGLEEAAEQRVSELSTGQHRRLAVAAAIIGNPRLVFLDEPSLGLDVLGRSALWSVLKRFGAAGTTVLLTTNAMEEAERLCDRVAFLHGGRVVEEGRPEDLIDRRTALHRIEFEEAIPEALRDRIRASSGFADLIEDPILGECAALSREPLAALRAITCDENERVPRFRWIRPRLEDVFHQIEGGPGPPRDS